MTASFHTELRHLSGRNFISYGADKYKITKVDITSADRTDTGQ
jgi:hypothetical protein